MAERRIVSASSTLSGGSGPVVDAATTGVGSAPSPSPADPDSEIGRLEAEIALKRARVADSLGTLRVRVENATSWRRWARAHPIAWLGMGLCLGVVFGLRGHNSEPARPQRRSRR